MNRLLRTDPEIRSAKMSAAQLDALRSAGASAIERWGAAFASFAQRPCLGVRDAGEHASVFSMLSYGELWDRVVNAATALGRGGIARPGDLVGLLGRTSVDWIVADLACLYVGAVSVPLQRAMSRDDLVHVAREAELACVVCAESDLDVARELRRRCSSIRDVVVIDCADTAPAFQDARSLAAVERQLSGIERLAPHVPADPASLFSIVYTSGSTGRPKGVMLTHGRWAETLGDAVRGNPLPAVTVAYLPLTHMAGRISVYATMMVGGRIHLVAEDDMPRLFDCIRATRPTTMTLVPRVSGMIHQMFLERCFKSGLEPPGSYEDPRVQAIVAEIRDELLGGRLCFAATGAAPTSPEVARFLADAVGIHVVDAYGSTEVARIAIDGAVQPGVEYKLIDVPELGYTRGDKPYPRGELAVRSPRETPGYFKNPDANAELRDADGFLRTGDIVEERGPRHIAWIDRKSDVIRLAQGEHVNVAKLEALFVARSPCIDQIFLFGGASRDCLLAVVVPNDAMVSSRRAGAAPGATRAPIDALLRAELDRVATLECLSSFEVPRAILMADEPFTRGNGLLSDAGKYRRPKLVERYRARLESLYRDIQANQIRAEMSVARLAGSSIGAQVLGAAAAVLGRASIAPTEAQSSFVGLGGDSLAAMRLKDILTRLLGRSVDVDALLDPGTSLEMLIARLADTSTASGERFERVHGADPKLVRAGDLMLEAFLPEQLLRAAPRLPLDTARRRVLLTGASGFLGHVLLAALLERLHGGQEIVCLVRAGSDAEAHARLARKLLGLPLPGCSLDSASMPRRVRAVAGDVAKPNLGLTAEAYRELAATVTDVVHAGALVNHVLSYRQLFRPNVEGTAEIMRFAITERRKRIHFASTTGIAVGVRRAGLLPECVSAAELWPKRRVRSDSNGDYAAGYVTSKWAAEVLLGELCRRCDVPVAAARCSMILPHRELPEVVNRFDAFARLIFGIVKTGIAPASFFADGYAGPRRYDGLPVDLVAAAIARVVTTSGEAFETYHVCTPSSAGGASLDDLIRWVGTAGYPIAWLEHGEWYPEFVRRLALLGAEEKKYSPEAIAHRWRRPAQDAHATIELDTAAFHGVLAAEGVAAVPSLDEAYVHRCVPVIVGASA